MNTKTTVLMAAVLAITTVLAAGLTVLPSSVQEAQANPCAENTVTSNDVTTTPGEQDEEIIDCDLTGVVISEDDD